MSTFAQQHPRARMLLVLLLVTAIGAASGGGSDDDEESSCNAAGVPDTRRARRRLIPTPRLVEAQISYPTGDKSFKVWQPWPSAIPAEDISPFLMADEWGAPTKRPLDGKAAADPGPPPSQGERHVGWHPHRGFDIVSYIREGRGSHADSMGNVAVVRPGGIQWLRCGSGIEHAEGGGNPPGAAKHGFQLWINARRAQKMAPPAYGTVQPEGIPVVRGAGGGVSRLLAGARGAAFTDRADDFMIADCELPAGATHSHAVPAALTGSVVVYAYDGAGTVGGRALRPRQALVLELESPSDDADGEDADADAVLELAATAPDGFAVMVFAGRPLGEPIAWRGPIVMSTQRELRSAYDELARGTFLKERVPFDYKAHADRARAVDEAGLVFEFD